MDAPNKEKRKLLTSFAKRIRQARVGFSGLLWSTRFARPWGERGVLADRWGANAVPSLVSAAEPRHNTHAALRQVVRVLRALCG